MLTHIDLFSGIGGFTLAAEWAGFRTIVFCEKDEYRQKVLQKRFGAVIADSTRNCTRKGRQEFQQGRRFVWDNKKPLIPDIRDFDGTKWRGATLLTGGFPCQPFSVAGKQRGKEDDRYLWPEMFRVIKEAKPHWILAENVAGIVRMALDTVLSDLESENYETGTVVIPACAVNASHRRDRVWIVAYAVGTGARSKDRKANDERGGTCESRRESIRQDNRSVGSSGIASAVGDVADSKDERLQGRGHGQERLKKKALRLFSSRPVINASDSRDITGWTEQEIEFGGKTRIEVGKHWRISQREWDENWLEVATGLCRVDDGIPDRVDRLKALGDAIVPQIAYEIIKRIAWIEKNEQRLIDG
jgi:DNA (cytosine-5)-methyltransferase 1